MSITEINIDKKLYVNLKDECLNVIVKPFKIKFDENNIEDCSVEIFLIDDNSFNVGHIFLSVDFASQKINVFDTKVRQECSEEILILFSGLLRTLKCIENSFNNIQFFEIKWIVSNDIIDLNNFVEKYVDYYEEKEYEITDFMIHPKDNLTKELNIKIK